MPTYSSTDEAPIEIFALTPLNEVVHGYVESIEQIVDTHMGYPGLWSTTNSAHTKLRTFITFDNNPDTPVEASFYGYTLEAVLEKKRELEEERVKRLRERRARKVEEDYQARLKEIQAARDASLLLLALQRRHGVDDALPPILQEHTIGQRGVCIGCLEMLDELGFGENRVQWPCPVVEVELTSMKHNDELTREELKMWDTLTRHRREV